MVGDANKQQCHLEVRFGAAGRTLGLMPNTAATVELVGGHVALDLVNTVSWRLDPPRRIEYLAGVSELATWLERVVVGGGQAAQLLEAQAPGKAARQALLDVRDLREQLHTVLSPLADGSGAPTAVDVAPRLNDRLTDAVAHSRLAGVPLRWAIEPVRPADVVRLLSLEVLDLLTLYDLARLRRCDGPGCGWVFLDRSRNHTRRWCSSADCGNRDRARRHYARHRAEGAPG
jgi:predicted RNA-binding Zn ribbon-like protein